MIAALFPRNDDLAWRRCLDIWNKELFTSPEYILPLSSATLDFGAVVFCPLFLPTFAAMLKSRSDNILCFLL